MLKILPVWPTCLKRGDPRPIRSCFRPTLFSESKDAHFEGVYFPIRLFVQILYLSFGLLKYFLFHTTLSGQTWLIIWMLLSLQHPLESLCDRVRDPDFRRISIASENPLFMLWWWLKKWESSLSELLGCLAFACCPLAGQSLLSFLCFAPWTITSKSS